MNIFVLDNDPVVAAQFHCDKHVIKMITESMQVMGSAMWSQYGITTSKGIKLLGDEALQLWKDFPRKTVSGEVSPYGIGFMNHPSTKWARQSKENWNWLLDMTYELVNQHENRWQKKTSTREKLDWFKANVDKFPIEGLTPFYQAVPIEIKNEDTVHAYRLYYAGWKEYFAKWKNGEPHWWKDYLKLSVEKNLMQDRVKSRLDSGEHTLSKL